MPSPAGYDNVNWWWLEDCESPLAFVVEFMSFTIVEARPVPAESGPKAIGERILRKHVERVAALLTKHDADAILLFRDSNILGFTGVPLAPSDRLICGWINRAGQTALVVPGFEADMARALPSGSILVTWQEHEDAYASAAEAARLLGVDRGRIYLDGYMWLDAQRRLNEAMPHASFQTDPGILDSIREVKSPEEIEAIRAACHDTGLIYDLVSRRLQPGISEHELSREVIEQLVKMGVTPFGDLIQGGESAAIPHQPAGPRRFRDGDSVIVDFVARKQGYLGDMTRTFALGRASDDFVRAYQTVRAAQQAAIRAARPGVSCESVDAAARSVIESAGLGAYFTHRLGHGIGLDVHEPPYLVRGNARRLEVGMCMTVEPGVYLPGRFGIRIEDVIAITADGSEVLSNSVPTDVCRILGQVAS